MQEDAFRWAIWPRRVADYWALTKFRQTALLLVTGLAGYLSGRGRSAQPKEALWMTAGLFFAIAGCTALNMVLDRDLDARMARTAGRPLPAGRLRPAPAALFGILLSALGLFLSFALNWRFGVVVAAGFIFDLLVYTALLKRRSALSIVFGGVAGSMPILAGRVLALGKVDLVGLLLAASVLFWIPAHILTLALHHEEDYRRAGIPTWPGVYGPRATRLFIASSSLLNALTLGACAILLRLHPISLALLLAMSLGLLGLALQLLFRPEERRNWLLFKAASVYMLLSSILLALGSLI